MSDDTRPGPAFRPLARVPVVSASIAEQILDSIRSGAFAVGDRLPSEVDLAREFGVSRPSVREALAALQFTGHVGSRRGFGTVVLSAETRADGPRARRRRRPMQTVGEAVDLLETRLLLEPYALATAATDPDPQALEAARELIGGMRLAVDQPDLHASSDLRVHRALLSVCRNQVLRESAVDLLDMAMDPVLRTARTQAWASPDLVHDWADHHQSVWQAIHDRDPEAARAGSIAHLGSVVDNLAAATSDDPHLEHRVRSLRATPGEPPVRSDVRTATNDRRADHG